MDGWTDGQTDKIAQVIAVTLRLRFAVRVKYTYGSPYQTAEFKSANIFAMAILGPTAEFNSHQNLRLYGVQLINLV